MKQKSDLSLVDSDENDEFGDPSCSGDGADLPELPVCPKILIVDDRAENLLALEALLQDCEADIVRANSGNEALIKVLKSDFALVLLDVQMPGMDGFEVAELMRSHPQTKSIPIIFVTAISKEKEHIFRGYESGAVDFLPKPIDAIVLSGKVRIFLDLWKQRRDLEIAMREKTRLGEKLEQQARYDSLTGLPNRILFNDRMKQATYAAERSGNTGALMFVDLDHFKQVNDEMGHEAGDILLKEVAVRLQSCVRKADTVARMGGDEFVVLAPNIIDKASSEIIGKKIIAKLSEPFQLGKDEAVISGSVGVTIFPTDANEHEELMRNADKAMYFAKQTGRNSVRYFSREMNEQAEQKSKREAQLRRALEQEEFSLRYQPKINVQTGKIVGTEALVRWHPDGEDPASPSEFIPIAEEAGLIGPLTEWVLQTACRQGLEWVKGGATDLRLAVNISARQFHDPLDLINMVTEVLNETGFEAKNLELEVAETAVMDNVKVGTGVLNKLREMGIHISIDDFGTGHSSLSSLKQFPLHTLKIDRSFIGDLSEGTDDAAITSAIISVAKKLSLRTIAEGVETEEQLAFLKENGCDEYQGYYFSRPLTPADHTKLLQSSAEVLADAEHT